jgi:hypothetical protein
MPDETEAKRLPSGAVARSAGSPIWILRHEKFVRAICMIAAYVFGAIFLISIFVAGLFAFISIVLAAMFLMALAIFFALWALKRRRP